MTHSRWLLGTCQARSRSVPVYHDSFAHHFFFPTSQQRNNSGLVIHSQRQIRFDVALPRQPQLSRNDRANSLSERPLYPIERHSACTFDSFTTAHPKLTFLLNRRSHRYEHRASRPTEQFDTHNHGAPQASCASRGPDLPPHCHSSRSRHVVLGKDT